MRRPDLSPFKASNLSFPFKGMTSYSRAERSNGPSRATYPFGRAEERRARGGQEHCKMLLLRELACGSCLNVESEANEESSAAPPLDLAPEVARSEAEGHGRWGRLSFAYVSWAGHPVAEQRRSRCAAGRTPRPPTSIQEQNATNRRREQLNRCLPSPPPSPKGRESRGGTGNTP